MAEPCTLCEDRGFTLREIDGQRMAVPCVCREQRRGDRLRAEAQVPARYGRHRLPSLGVPADADPSLTAAIESARQFAREYPVGTDGMGLAILGPNGTGKTTLAVALLLELMEQRGAQGLFVTYGELLKQVQHSYNSDAQQTEFAVLQPVFDAEVLVIDELGATRPTEWVLDTVAHILNARYNALKTTIVTSNYSNEAPLTELDAAAVAAGGHYARAAWRATYRDTLGDRVGERIRSRLNEMCRFVEIFGDDRRQPRPAVGRSYAISRLRQEQSRRMPASRELEQMLGHAGQARPGMPAELTAAAEPGPVGPGRMGSMARLRPRLPNAEPDDQR